MSLKPQKRRTLEERAEKDPNGPEAKILKVIQQEEAKAIDLLQQASVQAKKNMNRQKILIGVAMLAEAERNPDFKSGLRKVLGRHLTATRDINLMATFGWELEHESSESNNISDSSTAE